MSRESREPSWIAGSPPGGRDRWRLARLLVPNSLSILRMGLALAFPWAPASQRGLLVLVAGLSDVFDGRLSRALGGTSVLGQILDPVADKLFVGSVLLTLVARGELTVWELVLLAFRDLAVLAGTLWAVLRRGWRSLHHMPPSLLGKLATAGQFGFLLLLTLGVPDATLLLRPVMLAAVTLSVAAGLDYLNRKPSQAMPHENLQL